MAEEKENTGPVVNNSTPTDDPVQEAADAVTAYPGKPDWLEIMSDGEEGKVKCGSHGVVRIGLPTPLLEFAALELQGSTDPASLRGLYIQMLVEGVTEWDEGAWGGPVLADVEPGKRAEEFDRRSREGKIKSKWLERINDGMQFLSKN